MKTLISEERSTGMGATRFAAVLLDGKFVRISDIEKAQYKGREAGIEIFEIDVADDAVHASFYRSNKGNEEVEISSGELFHSFDSARRWAAAGDRHQ